MGRVSGIRFETTDEILSSFKLNALARNSFTSFVRAVKANTATIQSTSQSGNYDETTETVVTLTPSPSRNPTFCGLTRILYMNNSVTQPQGRWHGCVGARLWPDQTDPTKVKCGLLSHPQLTAFNIYYVAPELIGSSDLGLTRVVFSELEACDAAFMAKLNIIAANCNKLVGTGMNGSNITRMEVSQTGLKLLPDPQYHDVNLGYTPLFAFMSGFVVDGGNGTNSKLASFELGVEPITNGVRIYHAVKLGDRDWSYLEETQQEWWYLLQFCAIGSGTPTGYTPGLEFLIGDSAASIMTKLNQLAVNCDLVGGSVFGDLYYGIACTGKPPDGNYLVNNGPIIGPTNKDGSVGVETPFQPTLIAMGGFKARNQIMGEVRFNEHYIRPMLEDGLFGEEYVKVEFAWRLNDSGICNPHEAKYVVPYTFLYIPPLG